MTMPTSSFHGLFLVLHEAFFNEGRHSTIYLDFLTRGSVLVHHGTAFLGTALHASSCNLSRGMTQSDYWDEALFSAAYLFQADVDDIFDRFST